MAAFDRNRFVMTTKKTPSRKLKSGRRTARTQGLSQSAFAGYGTQQQAPEPPKKDESEKDKSEKHESEKEEANNSERRDSEDSANPTTPSEPESKPGKD